MVGSPPPPANRRRWRWFLAGGLAVLLGVCLVGVAIVQQWRQRTPPLHSWALGGAVSSVAFSPDGALLAAGNDLGTIAIWRVDDRAPVRSIAAGSRVSAITFAPDGQTIIAVVGNSQIVRWGLADGAPIGLPIPNDGSGTLAISPDGTIVAASNWEDVRLYRLTDGAPLGRIRGELPPVLGSNHVVRLVFTPDGTNLIAATADDLVRRIALPGGQLTLEHEGYTHLQVHSPFVQTAALSLDGQTIASSEGQGSVNVWNVEDGRLRHILPGPIGVGSLALAPDSTHVAAGRAPNSLGSNADGLFGTPTEWHISVWRVADGKPRARLAGHGVGVYCLTFDPRGRLLASGGGDGEVRLWAIP